MNEISRHVLDRAALPADFPTNFHKDQFWEALGRAIGTFGFLEEVLGKAIFAITATREYPEDEIEGAYLAWLPKLEKALSDPLGGLIATFGAELKRHEGATIANLDDLLVDLQAGAKLRNVLCHGSWRAPDANGRSIPFYVTKGGEVFETAVDIAFLDQTRAHTVELICSIIDTVTHMGWQFPGSSGPGRPLL